VERKSDSVAYVVPPAPGEPDAWTKAGGGQKLLDVGVVAAPEDVLSALHLEQGAEVVRRARLILRDGEPMEVAVSYWPAEWAAGTGLAAARPVKGGTVRLLADLGWRTADWVDDVDAFMSDEVDEAGVPAGVPVLAIYRTMLDVHETPFEYIVMYRWNRERQRYTGKAE
jgi:GntR family transcriptional regulator